MRRLIRLALALFVVLIVLIVAGILLLNTIVKEIVVSRLRTKTGMDVRIGLIDVGLLSPTVTIENFKVYNTADFGGSLFIDMPELHLEYDPFSLRSRKVHFKLVRLDLTEIDLVQDKNGRLNIQELGKRVHKNSGKKKSSSDDFNFTGIDTLNLTFWKFRMSNLGNGREEEIRFDITNQITHNVKSTADLGGLSLLLAARGGMLSSNANSPINLPSLVQNLIGH